MDCRLLFSVLYDCCRSFTITDAYSSICVVPRAHSILWTDGPVRFRACHCHIEWGERAINEFSRVVDFDSHQKILELWPALVHSNPARLQQFNYGLNSELKTFLMIFLLLLYDDYYQHNNTVASQLVIYRDTSKSWISRDDNFYVTSLCPLHRTRYQGNTFVWPPNTTNRNNGILIVRLSRHSLDPYSCCLCHW